MTFNKNNNIVNGRAEAPRLMKSERSIGELFINRLNQYANDVILTNGITGDKLTGTKLLNESIRLAKFLRSRGLKKGDRIGICSENRDEYAYVLLANFYLGTILVPMNTTYTERELAHALNLSEPTIFFTSPQTVDKVVKATRNLRYIKKIIVFGHQSNYSNIPTYINLFSNELKKDTDTYYICEPTNLDQSIALLLYSSGTTGLPKGVQLSQNNILTTCEIYCDDRKDEEMIKLSPNKVTLCVLPWFHTFGLHLLILSLINGELLIYLPKYEDRYFLETIEKYKVNTTYLVPPLLVFLAKNEMIDEYDLSSLKVITSGAAPLSKEVIQSVEQRIGIPWIRQGYGMSEGTCSFTVQNHVYKKFGSVGVLHPGLTGKVVDTETGITLGVNESGEICVKGKVIMKGYINNEEATRNMIDEDGWLHTGDIGYFDEDGELFIVDRLKELIKYKGFQVPPAEIEALLLTHPDVRDAAVIGIPDENAGELPLGFIVKDESKNITEREIKDFVAARSSPPKRLHGGVIFLNEIPKNPSGKILRKELRARMKKQQSKL